MFKKKWVGLCGPLLKTFTLWPKLSVIVHTFFMDWPKIQKLVLKYLNFNYTPRLGVILSKRSDIIITLDFRPLNYPGCQRFVLHRFRCRSGFSRSCKRPPKHTGINDVLESSKNHEAWGRVIVCWWKLSKNQSCLCRITNPRVSDPTPLRNFTL